MTDFLPSTLPVPPRLVLLLFLVIMAGPLGHAQTEPPAPAPTVERPAADDARDSSLYVGPHASEHSFLKTLAVNVFLDPKDIWTSPFHLSRSSAPGWIVAGVGTAALLTADHPTSQALPASGTSVHFGVTASRVGQWYAVFPVAGALYALGRERQNDKLAETGALSLQALVDTDLVVNVMKVATRRERPRNGDHGGHFEKGGTSFPSGHSAQAWALATVLASEYGNHRWVPYVSYGYAALVSTARVLAQDHFSSDAFVGGAIGFFVGRYVVRTQQAHCSHSEGKQSRQWVPSVVPAFSPVEKTVTLAWTY